MASDRRSILIFRPSSSRRTFSSRVPNRVSIWGLISMLFFIQYLALPPAHWMHGCLCTAETLLPGQGQTFSHVWRWNQPRRRDPKCKQLPLGLGYPRPTTRVNAAKLKVLLHRINPMYAPLRIQRHTKDDPGGSFVYDRILKDSCI